jgi:hypothetical protein
LHIQTSINPKRVGFNEPCLAQYKKYEVGEAKLDIGFSKNELIMQLYPIMYDETFNTYEEAESACLDKLIETIKNK